MYTQGRAPAAAGQAVLAIAAHFTRAESVVWAYVEQALDAAAPGTTPVVRVRAEPREGTIRIDDSGPGMPAVDLDHLSIHGGEGAWPRDPRPGAPDRWALLAAAFGIGGGVEIEAVRDGLAQRVRLDRADIATARGESLPVQWLARDEPTTRAPGTSIAILDTPPERIDVPGIVAYLERQLPSRRGARPRVIVNGNPCACDPPMPAFSRTFRPSGQQQVVMGDVGLALAVAQEPLPEGQRGVLILGGAGTLVAIENLGSVGRGFEAHLYGDIAVPNLDRPAPADGQAAPYGPRIDAQVAAAVVDFIHAKAAELLAQLLAVDRTSEWYRRGLVPPARVGQRPRRSRRHEVHAPAWLYVGSRVWRAEVLNVSEGGLLLLCPAAPAAADADIRFLLEEGRGDLEIILGEAESSAEVRIRHARACHGGVQVGLQVRTPVATRALLQWAADGMRGRSPGR